MRRTSSLLLVCAALSLGACDEGRNPSGPPGTMKGNATPGPETGSPQPNQGGIPAGQAEPQKPQGSGQ